MKIDYWDQGKGRLKMGRERDRDMKESLHYAIEIGKRHEDDEDKEREVAAERATRNLDVLTPAWFHRSARKDLRSQEGRI